MQCQKQGHFPVINLLETKDALNVHSLSCSEYSVIYLPRAGAGHVPTSFEKLYLGAPG